MYSVETRRRIKKRKGDGIRLLARTMRRYSEEWRGQPNPNHPLHVYRMRFRTPSNYSNSCIAIRPCACLKGIAEMGAQLYNLSMSRIRFNHLGHWSFPRIENFVNLYIVVNDRIVIRWWNSFECSIGSVRRERDSWNDGSIFISLI